MSLLPGGTTYNLTLADTVVYPFDVDYVTGCVYSSSMQLMSHSPWFLGAFSGKLPR